MNQRLTPEERQRRAWRREMRRDAGGATVFIAFVVAVIFVLAVWLLPLIEWKL